MAHLFRPQYTRIVPNGAQVKNGVARWKGRKGEMVEGILLVGDPTRCRVECDTWYVEYIDHLGKRCQRKGYRDKKLTDRMRVDIERDLERIQAGEIVNAPGLRSVPLVVRLVEDWRASMESRQLTEATIKNALGYVTRIIADCGIIKVGDITEKKVSRAIESYRKTIVNQSANHYISAIKVFCNWLVKSGYVESSPLKNLSKFNPDIDRKTERHAMTPAQVWKLIDATIAEGRIRETMSAVDRAAAYMVAAFTGIRLRELSLLTPESFHLDDVPAWIDIKLREEKARRGAPQIVPNDIVERLKAFIGPRPQGVRIWNQGGWAKNRRAAAALKKDLISAKIVAPPGKRIDFHSLRTAYVTMLARAKVPIQHAQKLARLGSVEIMVKHYQKLASEDLAAEVNRIDILPQS